jgi:hypothetical protein
MVAGVASLQFFAEIFWSTLIEIRAQNGDLVGQHSVVFSKRVPNNDPIKHTEPTGKQESRGQRKKHDKLRRD